MKIKKGENRIVIILGYIAVKIPRIRIYEAFKIGKLHIKMRMFFERFREQSYESPISVQGPLLKGIIDNWKEFRHKVHKRTLFSQYLIQLFFTRSNTSSK